MSDIPPKESAGSTSIPTKAPVKDKRNSGDIGWEFGFLPDPTNLCLVQCKLCSHKMKGGIFRLKQHLAGRGNNCMKCSKISAADRKKVQEAMDANSRRKKLKEMHIMELQDEAQFDKPDPTANEEQELVSSAHTTDESSKRSREPTVGPMDAYTASDPELAKRLKGKMIQPGVKEAYTKEKRDWVHKHVARWAYENSIPFHALSTDSFMRMCSSIGDYGRTYRPPSMYMLREPLLRGAVNETRDSLKEHEEEWGKSGCSIMTDAWSDRKMRSIMNLCIHSRLGTTFYKSIECSRDSHTGEYIFEWVDACIEEIGPQKVIQVVTDNASANMAAKEKLKEKRPSIFWTSCAAHTIDLMFEGIGKLPTFKETIERAKTLTVFIYSHHKILNMMRRMCEMREIVRPGVTRFATAFLTLRSVHEKKLKLRLMFSDEEWRKSKHSKTARGRKVEAIVLCESWWQSVNKLLKIYAPLFRMLRVVDSDYRPSMGFVVGMLEDTKEEIKLVLKRQESLCKSVIDIIHSKSKDRLYTPLHMAAYVLNPYYFFRDDVAKNSREGKEGFLDVVELLYPDEEHQAEVTKEFMEKYREGKGSFGRSLAVKSRQKVDFNPASWWYMYGGDCPFLQNLAMKVLNLTSSSSGCERNWSTFEGIHTKKRNRLESKRLEDLVFVKFNAKLKQKKRRGEDKDVLTTQDRTTARAWILDGVPSDDEEETYPGSGVSWTLVENVSGAAEVAANRRSKRIAGAAGPSMITSEEESLASDDDVTDEDEDFVDMNSESEESEHAGKDFHDDDD